MFKIGYLQFRQYFGMDKQNLERIISALTGVQADLIVLPELPFTGYYFKDREELTGLAEDVNDSPTIERIKGFCQQQDMHIVTGFAEKAAEKIFNSAILIGPGKIIQIYRKLHLFNTEKDNFDPGDMSLEVAMVGDVKIGMMVCFDWVFPEVARILALKGADILCHPANLVLTHCQQAMLTRSLENSVFTVTANRHGTEKRPHGELTFTGQSQITDPIGNSLSIAEQYADSLCVVEIDVNSARDKKMTDKNNLFSDRRPEFYNDLSKRYDYIGL